MFEYGQEVTGFLPVTLHFIAFFEEGGPFKVFQLREDISFLLHNCLGNVSKY